MGRENKADVLVMGAQQCLSSWCEMVTKPLIPSSFFLSQSMVVETSKSDIFLLFHVLRNHLRVPLHISGNHVCVCTSRHGVD